MIWLYGARNIFVLATCNPRAVNIHRLMPSALAVSTDRGSSAELINPRAVLACVCMYMCVCMHTYLCAMPQLASYLGAIGCRAAISSDRITARLANGPGLPAPNGTFPPPSFPQFSQYSSRLRYDDNANYSITMCRNYRVCWTPSPGMSDSSELDSPVWEIIRVSCQKNCQKSYGYSISCMFLEILYINIHIQYCEIVI